MNIWMIIWDVYRHIWLVCTLKRRSLPKKVWMNPTSGQTKLSKRPPRVILLYKSIGIASNESETSLTIKFTSKKVCSVLRVWKEITKIRMNQCKILLPNIIRLYLNKFWWYLPLSPWSISLGPWYLECCQPKLPLLNRYLRRDKNQLSRPPKMYHCSTF